MVGFELIARAVNVRFWPVAANGERQIATNPYSTHILDPVDGRVSVQAGREACQFQNQHLAQQGQVMSDEAPTHAQKQSSPSLTTPIYI